MIESMLERASSYAGAIDGQITMIALLTGFWFLVAEGVIFWLLFRFRKKPGQKGQYITGEKKEEKKWISIPHYLVLVCDVFIIVGAVRVWYQVKQDLPRADETVRIVAQQWAWTFVHAGPDGRLDTPDDIAIVDELHVQANRTYHYQLEARDVLHSFSVPVFRLKQDAIPGRQITGWFRPTQVGSYDIQCTEICGIGHGIMRARIFVESPRDHRTWITTHSNPTTASAAP